MSAPSEPEKYSVDEMLERLKNRPAEEAIEDGELVIRADGSQAIKVRKRKRRTQQPHKEERRHYRRIRMVQVAMGLILVLTVIVGVGTAIVYANSAPFREQLLRKISQSSGARAELEQFRMSPTGANAERVSLTWPEGNALRSLTMRNVKADVSLSSFLGQSLTGEEVKCGEATLVLQSPQPDRPIRDTPAPGGKPPVRFDSYATAKAEMILGDPAAPLISLRNSEWSFYPVGSNERTQLIVNRGDIIIPGWPKLRMDRAHIEFRGPEVDVIVMRLHHESDSLGVFELAGTISPYATGRSSVSVRLDDYLLSGIAGPELGRLFVGKIESLPDTKTNLLSFTLGPKPEASLSITFRNSPTSFFRINGFPFLLDLSKILGDAWFEQPEFDSNVSGTIKRTQGQVAFSDLKLESKSRLIVRGSLIMKSDRSLVGDFEVAVADAIIKTSKFAVLDTLFGPPKDGFRWISLRIGGSATLPTDNFRQLLENAKSAKPAESTGTTPTFEDLTTPKPGNNPAPLRAGSDH